MPGGCHYNRVRELGYEDPALDWPLCLGDAGTVEAASMGASEGEDETRASSSSAGVAAEAKLVATRVDPLVASRHTQRRLEESMNPNGQEEWKELTLTATSRALERMFKHPK